MIYDIGEGNDNVVNKLKEIGYDIQILMREN